MYIDEFQSFASDSFSVILSEARKYGLSLIMAHQSLTTYRLKRSLGLFQTPKEPATPETALPVQSANEDIFMISAKCPRYDS